MLASLRNPLRSGTTRRLIPSLRFRGSGVWLTSPIPYHGALPPASAASGLSFPHMVLVLAAEVTAPAASIVLLHMPPAWPLCQKGSSKASCSSPATGLQPSGVQVVFCVFPPLLPVIGEVVARVPPRRSCMRSPPTDGPPPEGGPW